MTERNRTHLNAQCDQDRSEMATDASVSDTYGHQSMADTNYMTTDHGRKRCGVEDIDNRRSKRAKGVEQCFSPEELSDQRRREEHFPEDDMSKDHESYKIGKHYVTRQALKDMIIKALDTGSLSGLHPAAYAKKDSIFVRSASLRFFEALRSLQEQGAHQLRLDLLQHRSHLYELSCQRGLLHIAMPGPSHEVFHDITFDIKRQMLEQNFLPHALGEDAIMITGNTTMDLSYDKRKRSVQPDSGLTIHQFTDIFLVLEIAMTESAKHVMKKAEDYILGSDPGVNFVIVVFVEKAKVQASQSTTLANKEDDTESTTAQAEQAKTVDQKKLTNNDKVDVSVFGRGLEQDPDSAEPSEVMTDLFGRVEVFPNPRPCSFTIRWGDVNQGDWDDFKSEYQLETDLPEPTCTIDLQSLLTRKARYSTKVAKIREKIKRPRRKRHMGTSSPIEPPSTEPSSGEDSRERRTRSGLCAFEMIGISLD